MEIQVTEKPEALESGLWAEINETYPYRSIFSTPEWNSTWWEIFGGGKELFMITFADPKPVGVCALILDRTERGGRLRFLGGDDLTDYLGPVTSDVSHLPAIADALTRFIKDEVGGWGYLEAKSLPVPFGFAEWLVEAADRWGLGFSIASDEVSAVLELGDDFDAYVGGLPSKRRHELRRKLRRFENECPGYLVRRSNLKSINSDLEMFFEMHRRSQGEKGSFMTEQRAGFFKKLTQVFGADEVVRLDFLEFDQTVLAAAFSFEFDGTFYLYNSAFESKAARLAPGFVLTVKLIEETIGRGLKRFDFLRGDERYKFDLGADALPLHEVTITNVASR